MTPRSMTAALILILMSTLIVGCVLKTMHPGHRLVARRCTSCHAAPDRDTLRTLDIVELRRIHEGRQALDAEQMSQVQAYAGGESPGDLGDAPSDR